MTNPNENQNSKKGKEIYSRESSTSLSSLNNGNKRMDIDGNGSHVAEKRKRDLTTEPDEKTSEEIVKKTKKRKFFIIPIFNTVISW